MDASSESVECSRDQLYKIGLPGKSIFGDYLQENRTSRRPFLLLRISFPGRPLFIQFIPDPLSGALLTVADRTEWSEPRADPPIMKLESIEFLLIWLLFLLRPPLPPSRLQFGRSFYGLSFGLKNGLRFHSDSWTSLNYSFSESILILGRV